MKTCFLIIVMLFGNMLFANTVDYSQPNPNQNVVISTNGLNLRAQPNLHSKKLIAVPYGEEVEIIDTVFYGQETIGTHTFFYGGNQAITNVPITGHWVKVSYSGMEGYMFNSFLGAKNTLLERPTQTSDYTIVLPEMQECSNVVNYNPDWHWYGLYNLDGKPALKKVELSFFITYYDNGAWLCTSTDDNKNLKLVIGSKMPMNAGMLNGAMYTYSEDNNSFFNWSEAGNFINDPLLQENGLEIRDSFEEGTWMETDLVYTHGRLEQILNSEEEFPSGILCRADLDGDRKDDYLLYFGEFYAELKLFLSSTADKGNGELLHYETSFYFPDCY
ncbi:MAG: SH3 domain-containing protein [Bacteroidetes bacterium]|nr:MAG: SH3 domain-containing protein [Bacteroidota bacterium]